MERILNKTQVRILMIAIWIIISALVILIFPTVRKGPLSFGPPAPMTTFQMSDGSFSISYPSNWVVFEQPQGSHNDKDVIATIIVSGRISATVKIARKSFQTDDFDVVFQWGQSRIPQDVLWLTQGQLSSPGSKLNGFIQEYQWPKSVDEKPQMRCQDTYFLENNSGYILSFCSQEKDWPALVEYFIKMQQSFSIKTEGDQ